MKKTIAFQYDRAGYYQGEVEADESPLEPGVYLLPARSTMIPPPADVPAGRCPRWNGASWVLVNQPPELVAPDPVAKLRDFLSANPDVAALLG